MTAKKSDVANVAQNLNRLLNSPTYRLAEDDIDFLKSSYGRESRILAEYSKVERTLERERIISTIIVFGSARIKSPQDAAAALQRVEKDLERDPNNPVKIAELSRAKTAVQFSKYYQVAREFGELVAQKNAPYNEEFDDRGGIRVSKERRLVVCTGGGPGIMEAANRGSYDADEASIGFNIKLPFEQQPNPFVSSSLCFNFRYFAIRKQHFMLRAKALVAFPGGFGTFDELFEALTLRQTGKMQDLPVVLYGRDFWEKVVNFQYLVDSGMISSQDLNLFHYAETPKEGLQFIKDYYEKKRD